MIIDLRILAIVLKLSKLRFYSTLRENHTTITLSISHHWFTYQSSLNVL